MTYMNSSADIKAFCGRNGGAVCTSSNAETALEWAFAEQRRTKVLFLPDQHLGRNTAVLKMGLSLDDCVVWDPHRPNGGLTVEQLARRQDDPLEGPLLGARPLLARVRRRLSRERIPGVQVLVHPECTHEVVLKADLVGSTEFIIQTIEAAPAGSSWAIGTELNLVKRLAAAHPDKQITFLDKTVCYCSTMNRIDLPHFVWAMESLVNGTVVNQIEVDAETEKWAKVALDRMLALPGKTHRGLIEAPLRGACSPERSRAEGRAARATEERGPATARVETSRRAGWELDPAGHLDRLDERWASPSLVLTCR